ncbi:MAG: hypothetical protein WCV50_06860 [Patescibacteria group bacterium]
MYVNVVPNALLIAVQQGLQDIIILRLGLASNYVEEAHGHLAAVKLGICDPEIGRWFADKALERAIECLS